MTNGDDSGTRVFALDRLTIHTKENSNHASMWSTCIQAKVKAGKSPNVTVKYYLLYGVKCLITTCDATELVIVFHQSIKIALHDDVVRRGKVVTSYSQYSTRSDKVGLKLKITLTNSSAHIVHLISFLRSKSRGGLLLYKEYLCKNYSVMCQ